MKIIMSVFALSLLAIGCAAQTPSDPDDTALDETGPSSTDLASTTAATTIDCDAPRLPCRDFCACQFYDCMDTGGIYRLCRAEYDGCIRDFCW